MQMGGGAGNLVQGHGWRQGEYAHGRSNPLKHMFNFVKGFILTQTMFF